MMKSNSVALLVLGGCLLQTALATPFHVRSQGGADVNELWLVDLPTRTSSVITTDLVSWQPSHTGLVYTGHLELDLQPEHDPCHPDPNTNYYRFEYRQER